MYESSQLALSVLASSAHSNLGLLILQHLVMGRRSDPSRSTPALIFFSSDFWLPTVSVYTRRKLRLYADGEIRVFLFRPLPFSWVIHMVFNKFFVSELHLYVWASPSEGQVFYVPISPYTPRHPLYTTFPAVCGRLLESVTAPFENGALAPVSVRWICACGGRLLTREIYADWYTNTHQFCRPQMVMLIRNNLTVYFHHLHR